MATRSKQPQSFLLAIILAIGAGTAWGLICVFILTVLFEPPRNPFSEQLVIRRDGTPLILSWLPNSQMCFRTLDGKSVERLRSGNCSSLYFRAPEFMRWRATFRSWQTRIREVSSYAPDPNSLNYWYFLHDGRPDGRGYFVGYDGRTNLPVGYLGRSGFRTDQPPPDDQFPINSRRLSAYVLWVNTPSELSDSDSAFASENWFTQATQFMLTDEGLVGVDPGARRVRFILKQPGLLSAFVVATDRVFSAQERTAPKQVIWARFPSEIVLFDAAGKRIRSYPLPAELRDLALNWYPVHPDKPIVIAGEEVFWLDGDGKITRRQVVDLKTGAPRRLSDTLVLSIAVPSPGFIVAQTAFAAWSGFDAAAWSDYSKEFGKRRTLLLITCITSSLLALACFWRQRQYGLPWTWAWTLLVLVFGLPALFGYLFHRIWPARPACPHCEQLSPRDRPACLACGRDFPAPAPKGTEVFA